ncbi:MAG: GDYXXLXY domain-containing protein [Hyphomicrobiaceae bacterium]|nr:GDYXXLXY domain-containing protein [Hyphomicrobiaceae bacterium]
MTLKRGIWPAMAAVAVLQSAALGWMVAERMTLLESGREIVLPIVPVDPRSLFRGDYVRLSYEVTRVPGRLLGGSVTSGEPLYVTIGRKPDGSYVPVAVSRTHPGVAAPDEVVLRGWLQRGRWDAGSSARDLFLRYGIESYFVPEGTGLELEDMAREKKLAAVVAVDRHGKSAIKGLMIDGRLVYEEPLF